MKRRWTKRLMVFAVCMGLVVSVQGFTLAESEAAPNKVPPIIDDVNESAAATPKNTSTIPILPIVLVMAGAGFATGWYAKGKVSKKAHAGAGYAVYEPEWDGDIDDYSVEDAGPEPVLNKVARTDTVKNSPPAKIPAAQQNPEGIDGAGRPYYYDHEGYPYYYDPLTGDAVYYDQDE